MSAIRENHSGKRSRTCNSACDHKAERRAARRGPTQAPWRAPTAAVSLCLCVSLTRCSASGLVEHLSDVCLALSEPHGEQLGSLDGDEVGRRLVRDGLGQQSLSASRRSEEQAATRRLLTVFEEDLRMLERPLDHFDELLLDILQTTNVGPLDVGHLFTHSHSNTHTQQPTPLSILARACLRLSSMRGPLRLLTMQKRALCIRTSTTVERREDGFTILSESVK